MRHPEGSALYRVVERHLDTYLGCYDARFEPRHGPLRSVVQRTAEAYLECGRLQNGFARIRCPRCRGEHPDGDVDGGAAPSGGAFPPQRDGHFSRAWEYLQRWAGEFARVPGREDLPDRVARIRAEGASP